MRVGDIGTRIEVTIVDAATGAAVNISTATTRQFRIRYPSGRLVVKTVSFATDGTNGVLRWTTVAGDITEAGQYTLQAHVVYSAGTFFSSAVAFEAEHVL